ncbi:hypothetical protein [Marinagarivorans cellulosilyticus]|uniref:Uncharacterized protein n=1 Tax=Marinagarivorans cellulosilyticus TaxID=2721545 RepID=A0AAN1WFZ0_9GAMM|nr:hypothetical protein [Marinagarivorans cellulosilyticus]BCD96893.1 hypothetical protein MARGE09_P1093 [Marinagarivorans cellulosilyticus]
MRTKKHYPHPIFIAPAYKATSQHYLQRKRTIGQLALAIIILLTASIALQNNAVASSSDTPQYEAQITQTQKSPNHFTSFANSEKKLLETHAKNNGEINSNTSLSSNKTWSNFSWWLGILCFMGYLLMHAIRNEP